MASPFDNFTLDQVLAELAKARPACAAVNRRFYDGDHWQEGAQWIGPRPDSTDPEALRVLGEIAKAFTPQNAIKETTDRHTDGIVGKEPAWGFTVRRALKEGKAPTRAEQALIDEAEAAITSWWDARKALAELKELARTLLLGGRASLRLFVPSGLRTLDPITQQPIVPVVSKLEQALGYLYLDRPAVGAAGIIVDPATQQHCGAYVYTERSETLAELSYLDLDTGETVLRILRSSGSQPGDVWRYKLGGHLLLHEMQAPALITDPVRRLQNQLNMARTMSGRNVVQGGFLERLILNAQMPGSYVDDPTAEPDSSGRRRRFVPRSLRTGAGRTNFISGQPIYNEKGQLTGYTPASVVFRDPVSTTTFEEAVGANHRSILQEVRQLHALISGDSTASGAARIQARADFAKSLAGTKIEIDALGRWLIETVLAIGAMLAGTPGRYDALRATFDSHIDTGPISADERRALGEEVDKGRLSLETFLALVGHDDVDAEKTRIAAEKARIAAEKAERIAQAQAAAPADPNAPTDPNAPNTPPPGQGGQAQGQQRPSAQGAAV